LFVCFSAERSSTRIHAAPGGKDSICFGSHLSPKPLDAERQKNINRSSIFGASEQESQKLTRRPSTNSNSSIFRAEEPIVVAQRLNANHTSAIFEAENTPVTKRTSNTPSPPPAGTPWGTDENHNGTNTIKRRSLASEMYEENNCSISNVINQDKTKNNTPVRSLSKMSPGGEAHVLLC
jgi:hypothetical protein